jgi:hypothetical protein
MQFTDRHCFLCGKLTSSVETISVYPEWIIDRYQLSKKPLQFLDKSIRLVSDLTIPCCSTCASTHVEPLDTTIRQAADAGKEGWQKLEEKQIFLWLSRFFYGMLVTELKNELNPLVSPEYGVGTNPKMLLKFQSFFFLLQALRVPIAFEDFSPCSLFLLEALPEPEQAPFEFQDDLTSMMISLKIGNISIICCLLDNGLVKNALRKVWEDVRDRRLHPKQLAEFKARVFYGAYLLNVTPEYFARPVKPGDSQIVFDTLIDDVSSSVFNPWENQTYAQALEEMLKPWDIRQAEIMQNPQKPLSFIYDENLQFKDM